MEAKSLIEEIKENSKRLEQCAGPHDFSVDLTPQKVLGKRWQCTKCKGTIETLPRMWYQRGLKHGQMKAPVKA